LRRPRLPIYEVVAPEEEEEEEEEQEQEQEEQEEAVGYWQVRLSPVFGKANCKTVTAS
jgi:hypothetical protein